MSAPIGIYVRVSRKGDREDERFHSPREQRERAEALVRAKGYTPGPVFEDIDVSGAKAPAERPGMGRLLKAIETGELGGIAAFSLDRLSREPAHGDTLVKRVTKAGGIVLTPDIPDAIDSPTGEFTFGMLLQVAKLYRATAGARFASAKERSILAGVPVGPAPIGWTVGPDRKLAQDPETAPLVRELYERWNRGEGREVLAKWLMERTGRTWTRQAIPAIIRRRLNATGRLEYGDLVSEHVAEPIVDEATWQAAQVARPGARQSRSRGKWLLTGLAKCAACGQNLTPTATGQTPEQRAKYRSYRCRNLTCTERAHVNAPRLERYVAMRTAAVQHELRTASKAPDLSALEDRAAVAERRLEQVMAPEARDALGDLWVADVKARRIERDAALAALGEARQAAGDANVITFDLAQAWEHLSGDDRRAALQMFWKEIRVGRAPGRGPGGRNGSGTPLTFVARGPHVEAELTLPDTEGRDEG